MSSYNIVICMSCLQIVLLTIFIDRSPYLLIGKNNLDIMCDIQDTLKSVDVSYSTICPSCNKQNSQYQADVCYQCLTGFQMSKPNMVVDNYVKLCLTFQKFKIISEHSLSLWVSLLIPDNILLDCMFLNIITICPLRMYGIAFTRVTTKQEKIKI
jgi:hypothetical protein